MDDVKECHFTDKDKALKHVEALKKLSMAVDATIWMEEVMTKFIRVTNIAQGVDVDTILNVDDIGHISIGPNIIFVKTPFADGTNRIYVRTDTIEQLEKILLGEENDD